MRMKKALRRMAWLGAAGAIGTAAAGVGVGLLGLAAWRRTTGGEEVNGRVALITGASRGLGLAMARELGQQGAMLVICARDREELDWAREELARTGADVLAIQCDVGNHDDVHRMVREAMERFGRIDILVNNAAVQFPQDSIEKISSEQLDRTFRTNIYAMFYTTRAALKHLREGSTIINTTSVTAYRGSAHLLDYSATKGAIVAFTRSLSQALADKKIRVNAVAPGPIWTPLIAVSVLVWFVLAMQCMSTLAVVRRETGGWKWPLFMLLYMNGLAYTICLLLFQIGSRM